MCPTVCRRDMHSTNAKQRTNSKGGNYENINHGKRQLPVSLPRNDAHINTDAGDLILYQSKSFVIYYDKNSWSLTPLGKIEGISKSGLKALLGAGSVTVQLSIGGA